MRTKRPDGLARRRMLVGGVFIAVLGLGAWAFIAGSGPAYAETVRVVMSPTCGCCGDWVRYLERSGFRVEIEHRYDVNPVKRESGVPAALASCHTAFVGGYVVEGHVPAPAIERLLADRPDLAGIAVPGMPADAPGMAGGGVQDVIDFRDGVPTALYMRAQG